MELNPAVQKQLDQIAKLPAAARAGIAAALVVLIAVGYYLMMWEGANQQLTQMRAQELELQRKLSEVRSIAANINEFEAEIDNLELKLQKVVRQLPNKKEIEVLLTDISNAGKMAGVEIKSFSRRAEIIHGFYAEVPIDLTLTGNYHNIARFFDLLAGLPRIVNMGSVNVTVAKDSMEETILNVKGTATTFRFVGGDKRA